jgi:hypothetical protein
MNKLTLSEVAEEDSNRGTIIHNRSRKSTRGAFIDVLNQGYTIVVKTELLERFEISGGDVRTVCDVLCDSVHILHFARNAAEQGELMIAEASFKGECRTRPSACGKTSRRKPRFAIGPRGAHAALNVVATLGDAVRSIERVSARPSRVGCV